MQLSKYQLKGKILWKIYFQFLYSPFLLQVFVSQRGLYADLGDVFPRPLQLLPPLDGRGVRR